MSFWTTISFLRPSAPPQMAVADLVEFVRKVGDCGLNKHEGDFEFRVRIGHAIDQDAEDTNPFEDAGGPFSRPVEYPWDVECEANDLEQLLQEASLHQGTVYRAYVDMGCLKDEISISINHPAEPPYEQRLEISDLTVEVGPAVVMTVETEPCICGWIAVNLSGYGLAEPWEVRGLIGKLREHAQIRRFEELCERTWPVAAKRPVEEFLADCEEIKDCFYIPEGMETVSWLWAVSTD